MSKSREQFPEPNQWLLHLAASTGMFDQSDVIVTDFELEDKFIRFAKGETTSEDDEALIQAIDENPRLLGHLRRHLAFTQQFQTSGELAVETVNRLRESLQRDLPRVHESFDFSILFDIPEGEDEIEQLRYDLTPAQPLEVAGTMRGDEESAKILSHRQELSQCRLKVTVEVEGEQRFSMTIEFEFVAPAMRSQLSVQVHQQSTEFEVGTVRLECERGQNRLTFDDLSPGDYLVEICSSKQPFDQFKMRIQRSDP